MDSLDNPGENAPLSAQAAAALLDVHHRTIRRAIARGDLPAVKYAGTFRIDPADLERFRDRLSQPAPPRGTNGPTRTGVATGPRLLTGLRPLPAPLSPLIGREREVASIATMLRRSDRPTQGTPGFRLVTLTGPGGIGKTRLAISVAGQIQRDFDGGVAFVNLAPIRDAELLAPAMLDTLGLRRTDHRPAIDHVTNVLRNRHCLIVLDNFEQVLSAAPIVAELLASCPELTLLVTSRAPLNLAGERRFQVPPLALPDAVGRLSIDRVITSEAVRLFVERAQAINPDFTLSESDASIVAEICARLDSLPLAIELAAARTGVLAPKALLARLERRLPILTGGPADAPIRLQTMRNAIAWSYDLLSPAEQTLFRRLSIFVGGFTLEAAEAVGGQASSILDETEVLVKHSLLHAEVGKTRYALLETVREYGLALLAESGELDVIRDMHAAFFVALAERAEASFWGTGTDDWHTLLEAETANIRAARDWLIERGTAEEALRLAAALEPLWWIVGQPGEGLRWLEQSLADSTRLSTQVKTKGLVSAGRLLAARGEYARALALAGEALRLAHTGDDLLGLARATELMGLATQFSGDGIRARSHLEQAVTLYRELNEPGRLGRALGQLGTLGDLGTFATGSSCLPSNADGTGPSTCCQSADVCGAGGIDLCCPEGTSCDTVSLLFPQVDRPVCCPSGSGACLDIDLETVVCCGGDNACLDSGFRTIELCCPADAELCLASFGTDCCEPGTHCTRAPASSGLAACCPPDHKLCQDPAIMGVVCCGGENSCQESGGFLPTEFCCPRSSTPCEIPSGATICCPQSTTCKSNFNGSDCCPTGSDFCTDPDTDHDQCCVDGRTCQATDSGPISARYCCPPGEPPCRRPGALGIVCCGDGGTCHDFENFTDQFCCPAGHAPCRDSNGGISCCASTNP